MDRKNYYGKWWIDLKNDPIKLQEHYDKQREQRRKRKLRHPNDVIGIVQKRNQQWRENNQERYLWQGAKASARSRGLEFDIEVSDIVIPEKCPYLETPLTNIQGNGQIDSNASIDRIDNSKGYIKGNIEIISRLANRMKMKATKEQLLLFAKNTIDKFST